MTPADLAARRHALGLSQAACAAMLGVHRITIVRWESGVRTIPPLLGAALRDLERARLEAAR